ncbi:hypothetical protein F5H01DRAFT_354466, partial [Linnemannia elongata]
MVSALSIAHINTGEALPLFVFFLLVLYLLPNNPHLLNLHLLHTTTTTTYAHQPTKSKPTQLSKRPSLCLLSASTTLQLSSSASPQRAPLHSHHPLPAK